MGLVACCAAKRREATEARFLYTSQLFVASARAVIATCDTWGILSARYGLVLPTQRVAPYELTLAMLNPGARQQWATTTNHQLKTQWPQASFLVFAGKQYLGALAGLEWTNALEGLGIHGRVNALKEKTWKT